jgi:hypothetical protein
MAVDSAAKGEALQPGMPSGHKVSVAAARLSIAAAGACLLLLASLHVLSHELDPSFRVVSEYANGQYGWILSLMFAAWAVSSWASALTIWPQVQTRTGRIGLGFLGAAGVGEAMASVFDINHPLHSVAGLLGVGGLPVAAMLISPALIRIPGWSDAKRVLLWTANLTWVILVLMIAALIVIHTVAIVGYPNRMLVVLYCVWVMTVARQAIKQRDQSIQTREGMSSPREQLL